MAPFSFHGMVAFRLVDINLFDMQIQYAPQVSSGGIFTLGTPWKLENVDTFDVPFMTTMEHRCNHSDTPW